MESCQLGVAAVAERGVFGMLAATPGDGFGLGDVRLDRREAGAFVRAVAERLAFRLTATAPEMGARLGGLNKRSFAGDVWFTHIKWI